MNTEETIMVFLIMFSTLSTAMISYVIAMILAGFAHKVENSAPHHLKDKPIMEECYRILSELDDVEIQAEAHFHVMYKGHITGSE